MSPMRNKRPPCLVATASRSVGQSSLQRKESGEDLIIAQIGVLPAHARHDSGKHTAQVVEVLLISRTLLARELCPFCLECRWRHYARMMTRCGEHARGIFLPKSIPGNSGMSVQFAVGCVFHTWQSSHNALFLFHLIIWHLWLPSAPVSTLESVLDLKQP